MEPRTNLLNSLSTFRWGAQWGKLSKEGEFADKEGRTVSLLTLFIDTTSQLLDFLRYSHADSFELDRIDLNALKHHTITLKKKYIHTVGNIFSGFLSSTPASVFFESGRLLQVAAAVNVVIGKMQGMPHGNLNQALDILTENCWKRILSLLEPLENGSLPLAPIRHQLTSWTTEKCKKWIGKSQERAPGISPDHINRLLPYLDLDALKPNELEDLSLFHLNPPRSSTHRNWKPICEAYRRVADAKEKCGHSPLNVRQLRITHVLMSIFDQIWPVYSVRSSIVEQTFPHIFLNSHKFVHLLPLLDAGVLTGAKRLPGINLDNPLSLAIMDPQMERLLGESPLFKAAVFVLRLQWRSPIKDREVLHRIFLGLSEFPVMPTLEHLNAYQASAKPFFYFYSLMETVKNTQHPSFNELETLYPSYAAFIQAMQRPKPEWPTAIHDAVGFVHEQEGVSFTNRSRLFIACVLDRAFPNMPEREALSELTELEERDIHLLAKEYPYIHGLIHLGKKGLSPEITMLEDAPLDLIVIMDKLHLHKTYNHHLSLSDWSILDWEFRLKELKIPKRMIPWLSVKHPMQMKSIDLSGSRKATDALFAGWIIPRGCTAMDLSDTQVTPETVRILQAKRPRIRFQYRNSLAPGHRLLTIERSLYAEALEKLIEPVASNPPQLDPSDVEPFLEYCFTHQIVKSQENWAKSLSLKAIEQGWKGIGEYCLAALIASVQPRNLIELWHFSKTHPFFIPLRHHCARFALAFCVRFDGQHRSRFFSSHQNTLLKMAHEVTLFPDDQFEPPLFQPVDLGAHFKPDHIFLCSDGAEVSVNLLFLSLHSSYFQMMLETNQSSHRSYDNDWITDAENGREMTEMKKTLPDETASSVKNLPMVSSFYMRIIDAFLRTNTLPANLEPDELHELINISDFLMLPAVCIAATEQLKK